MDNRNGAIWSRNFTSLVTSNAMFFGGFHMLLPSIPLLASTMGGSKTQIGLISGIFVLSSVITRFFTDACLRLFGRRNCLLIGIGISLLSAAGYVFMPTIQALMWLRILHGVGFGLGTTFYIVIVTEFIPASRRGEGLGYFGLATTIAMAVAPATGLWVAERAGFSVMFGVSAACEVAAMLILTTCSFASLGSTRPQAPQASPKPAGRKLAAYLVEPGTAFLALLVVLFGVGYGSVLNFIAVHATELHLADPGRFFVTGTASIFLARLLMGRVYDRKGAAWLILPGAVLLLSGLVLVARTTTMTSYLAASALYGLGVGMLFPALQTEIINAVPSARRGGASATFSNALDLGLGSGSVLLGLYAQRAGLSAAYLCAAATTLLLLAVYCAHLMGRRGLLAMRPAVDEESEGRSA